jgi:hypothetical protein
VRSKCLASLELLDLLFGGTGGLVFKHLAVMARLRGDFDAPRLHCLRHFTHEVDFEQAMLECCTEIPWYRY